MRKKLNRWGRGTYSNHGSDDERVVVSENLVVGPLEADMQFGASVTLHVLQRLTRKGKPPEIAEKRTNENREENDTWNWDNEGRMSRLMLTDMSDEVNYHKHSPKEANKTGSSIPLPLTFGALRPN